LIIYSFDELKKALLSFLFLTFLWGNTHGQGASFVNADVGLTWNHQGFFKLYNGIVDAGAGYHISLFNELYGGLSFQAAFLNYKNTPARSAFYRPQFNLLYSIHISPRIAVDPVVAIGYSFVRITNIEYAYAQTQAGINYSANLKLRWKSSGKIDYYIFGRYDYIYLNKNEAFTQLDYFRQIQLFAVGIGLQIKSRNDD
jgi:hypothetical protein